MPKGLGKALENALTETKEDSSGSGVMGSHTRENLFIFLTYRPLSNKAAISEALGVAGKTVSWHISKLVDKGFVTSREKMYYPTGLLSPEDVVLASIFSKKDARSLFSIVSKRPGITLSDAAEDMDAANSRTSTLAKILGDAGALSRVKDGRSTRLYPTRLLEDKKREYKGLAKKFISHLSKLLQQEGVAFEVKRTGVVRAGDLFVVTIVEGGKKRELAFNTNPFITLLQEELPVSFQG